MTNLSDDERKNLDYEHLTLKYFNFSEREGKKSFVITQRCNYLSLFICVFILSNETIFFFLLSSCLLFVLFKLLIFADLKYVQQKYPDLKITNERGKKKKICLFFFPFFFLSLFASVGKYKPMNKFSVLLFCSFSLV